MTETYDEHWERQPAPRPGGVEFPNWRQPDESAKRDPIVDRGVRETMEPYECLEAELASWAGYEPEQVVVCSTGSAALHLALEAFQLPAGSEVVMPDFTFIACARAVTLAGLRPVFVDCGDDLLIDPDLVARQGRTTAHRAVMGVHIYGRRCNIDSIVAWAKDKGPITKNEWVVEDLAEAHGVKPHPLTDAACWSFYRNKIVAGEEGGAVAFRDPKHAALARALRSQGYTGQPWMHLPRAMNYRMTNGQADLIRRSLSFFQRSIEQRRTIESWYDRHCPLLWRMPPRQAPWVYDIRIPGGTFHQSGRDTERQTRMVNVLHENGIAARHAFKPMHYQQEYAGCRVVGNGRCEIASREVICLPIQPGVTSEADCRRAFELLRSLL